MAKVVASYTLATTITALGVRAIIDPVDFAESFGIPASYPNDERATYIPPMGGRDVAYGLLMGIASYKKDWNSVGTMCCVGVIIDVMDTVTTLRHRDVKGMEALPHVIGGAIMAAMGGWLLIG